MPRRSIVALLLAGALLGLPGCGVVESSAKRVAASVVTRVFGAGAAAVFGAPESEAAKDEAPARHDPRSVSIAADEKAAGEVVEEDDAEVGSSAFYKIVEPNGTVRFTSNLSEVPVDQRPKAERLAMAPSRPAGEKPRSRPILPKLPKLELPFGTKQEAAAPPAARARSGTHEVVLYTTSWCGWCKRTRTWLDQQGVRYEDKDVERDSAAAEEMRELVGGDSGVPVVVIDGEVIQGFNQRRMEKLLQI